MARKEGIVASYSHLSSIWSYGSTSQTYRREVVAAANRRVPEVGVGLGLNFSLYGKLGRDRIRIDAAPRLLAIALLSLAPERSGLCKAGVGSLSLF